MEQDDGSFLYGKIDFGIKYMIVSDADGNFVTEEPINYLDLLKIKGIADDYMDS